MKLFVKILWLAISGIWMAIEFFVCGMILCIMVFSMDFGVQFYKFAGFVLNPFGKKIHVDFNSHPVYNTIWIILLGLASFILYMAMGLFWCITIVGVEYGKQCFRLAILFLMPFGATISN